MCAASCVLRVCSLYAYVQKQVVSSHGLLKACRMAHVLLVSFYVLAGSMWQVPVDGRQSGVTGEQAARADIERFRRSSDSGGLGEQARHKDQRLQTTAEYPEVPPPLPPLSEVPHTWLQQAGLSGWVMQASLSG